MTRAFDEHQETPMWRVVAAAVAELEATREITVSTATAATCGRAIRYERGCTHARRRGAREGAMARKAARHSQAPSSRA